ncbi:hypothetical protein [Cohnella soli]|uniref:Alpha-galactosidase n=1 Tax=Cohnella soli TaxID=425005 RepID=A0ABW0I2Q2_9BACL
MKLFSTQASVSATGIEVGQNGSGMHISLSCPLFITDQGAARTVPAAEAEAEAASAKAVASGSPVKRKFQAAFPGTDGLLEIELNVQWFPAEGVWRKWARYKADALLAGTVLQEVVLEQLDTETNRFLSIELGTGLGGHASQSQPAFFQGFFAGIEFPVASTRLEEGRLIVAHRPGVKLQAEAWAETKKVVYGLAAAGGEKAAFQAYVRAHSVTPEHFHFNYNSWYTSPVPYSEDDILGIMRAFKENLYDPHGISFDTFCIDMGWSNPHSIWEINERLFPEGFAKLEQAAAAMNSSLGLWISPTACYMDALDKDWAKEQGYGTSSVEWSGEHTIRYVCLGDPSYQAKLKERLIDLVRRYRIRHIKFDGCMLECQEPDHGHAVGNLSTEAIAEGIIDVFVELHKVQPEVWFETTCFGWNPSPWWLFYVNSVLGTHGDDVPFGRVPAPVYRESYTSARDFFNLQGSMKSVVPEESKEVLGFVHQTQDPLLNDGIMTIMRGHKFFPVYMNPNVMNADRWKQFADLLKWARANETALANTEPLLPVSWTDGGVPAFSNDVMMPREPYGYAHWGEGGGLIVIRNPWIRPGSYRLEIPADLALSAVTLNAVSLYPETRVYGREILQGQTLDVPLAPYETVLLSIGPNQSVTELNFADEVIKSYIQADIERSELTPAALSFEALLDISTPDAELIVLFDGQGTAPVAGADQSVKINGVDSEVEVETSEAGWAHSWIPKKEDWCILKAPLVAGQSRVEIEWPMASSANEVSIWVWATRPGARTAAVYPNALPEPERLSLSARRLFEYKAPEPDR